MSIEQTERPNYMPALDGLRGFACMLVVASHINGLLELSFIKQNFGLGSSGVLLFFSLSGFLMGTLYFRQDFTLDMAGKYVIARFSRITPAYYIAIIFCLFLSLFMANFEYAMDPVMVVRSFAFMGSVGVLWSIPPEVQFYGFFLLLWGAYDRWKQGKFLLMGMVVVLSVVFIATRDMWGGILLPSKYHIFLCGFLASIALLHPAVHAISRKIWFQFAIVAATVAYITLFLEEENIYIDLVLPVLVAATVMSLSHSTLLTKILEADFMRVVGAASFSIYLFHEPLMLFLYEYLPVTGSIYMHIMICAVVSLAFPVAFHYMAERHLNKETKNRATRLFEHAKKQWLPKVWRPKAQQA